MRPRPASAAAANAVNATPTGDSPGTGTGLEPITATGVIAAETDDTGPLPLGCCACTVKVYGVPFANPVTVQRVAGAATLQPAPPGLAVTV